MTEIVPAMFEHCARVYTAMEKDSKVEIDDNDTQMRVYEGHLTRVFAKLELSTPYYTTIMKHLKRMGCVEQIRRGGGSQTSKWRLIKEPDAQAFDEAPDPVGGSMRTRLQQVEQQNRMLTQRVAKMEQVMQAALGVRL
jgi:hypothetical protein